MDNHTNTTFTNGSFDGVFNGTSQTNQTTQDAILQTLKGLSVPIGWFGTLILAMIIFSRIYRGRKQAEVLSTEPWFPNHKSRDLYISLLQSSSDGTAEIDDKILQAALLNRAKEDVKRIWALRDHKQALQTLIQKGALSESTATKFAAAEKELEAEILEVATEAATFRQGWQAYIFASASEMAQRDKVRDILEGIGRTKAEAARKWKPKSSNLPAITTNTNTNTNTTPLPVGPTPVSASATAPEPSAPSSSSSISSTPARGSTPAPDEPVPEISTPKKQSPVQSVSGSGSSSPASMSTPAPAPALAGTPIGKGTTNSPPAVPSPAKSTPGKNKKKGKKH